MTALMAAGIQSLSCQRSYFPSSLIPPQLNIEIPPFQVVREEGTHQQLIWGFGGGGMWGGGGAFKSSTEGSEHYK